MEGQILIHVRLESKKELVTFYVAQRLSTSMILRCDFCDKNVEAIRPSARTFELDYATTLPIILKPSPSPQNGPPVPEYQQVIPRLKRVCPKIKTVHKIVLSAESQTWVQVTTKKEGLIFVTPTRNTYDHHLCLSATAVAKVKPDDLFRILGANFSKKSKILLQNQHIADLKSHPTALLESDATHTELLGVTTKGEPINQPKGSQTTKMTYRKPHLNTRDEQNH